jgi:hypothetical protein
MKEHRWEIETEKCPMTSGEDTFPPLNLVDEATSLVLTLPKIEARFRVQVPKGKRLVFFRRNQILYGEDGTNRGRLHAYWIGWKSREAVPKEKFVQMVHVTPKGELLTVLLHEDGRTD